MLKSSQPNGKAKDNSSTHAKGATSSLSGTGGEGGAAETTSGKGEQ